MDPRYLQRLSQRAKKRIDNKITDLKADQYYYWDFAATMAGDYEIIAMTTLLLDQDIPGFKQHLYMAGKCVEAVDLAEPYNVPDSPHYTDRFFMHNMLSDRYQAFFWALISENEALINSLAHLLGWKGEKWEFREGPGENTLLGFVMKYLLLKEDQRAEVYFTRLKKVGVPRHMEGYLTLLEGVFRQDRVQAQQGLEAIVETHPLDEELMPIEQMCCMPALGLGWLAKRRGLDVKVDHPTAPGEVFEHHQLDYPSLDFFPKEIQDKTWRDRVEERYP